MLDAFKAFYFFYLITQSSYQHSWRVVGKRYGSQRQDSGTDRSAPYRQERTDQETQSDEHFRSLLHRHVI